VPERRSLASDSRSLYAGHWLLVTGPWDWQLPLSLGLDANLGMGRRSQGPSPSPRLGPSPKTSCVASTWSAASAALKRGEINRTSWRWPH